MIFLCLILGTIPRVTNILYWLHRNNQGLNNDSVTICYSLDCTRVLLYRTKELAGLFLLWDLEEDQTTLYYSIGDVYRDSSLGLVKDENQV